jgi:APA family basic amino acid/polyamine antiporter
VGIVVANMIGAGVFLSAGFMAQDLGPGHILLAWGVGLVLALAGALTYATVAERLPRSGGEYRYLSELLHPALGALAGWASLLLGFTAPIAVDALAAGAFAQLLWPGLPPKAVAVGLVVTLTGLHAWGLEQSLRTQNLLVALKILLVAGFVLLGVLGGSHTWPDWQPPRASEGFPLAAFMGSLFYIAFAFSGWNAAIYAAEEFHSPRRDVPRAMLLGALTVGGLYLLVNWVFVANLTPDQASAVFRYEAERVTLGHLITRGLIGESGAAAMSGLMVVAFASAMSAMTFLGPRVIAAMARDGYLPRGLAGRPGRPPRAALALQAGLCLLIVFFHDLGQVLQNVGAVLTLFSALVALGLLRLGLTRGPGRPAGPRLAAAGLVVLSAAWMLYFGFKDSPSLLLWIGAVAGTALGAHGLGRIRARLKSPPETR